MIEVEAPDGTIVEFPDGTAPETVKQVMTKHFGGPTAPANGTGLTIEQLEMGMPLDRLPVALPRAVNPQTISPVP